jgi:centrosomal protein CEP135
MQLDMQKETQGAQHAEIEQHLKTEDEYDRQNQRLNGALANAEDKIIELRNQLRVGGENVVHLREMNARLQNDLDTQFTQHTQYKMVNEKSVADVGEIKQSYDAAKHELEAEQAHARELELLVQKSRHKEFEIQLDAAQLKEELLQERDRANHSEQQVNLYERQVTEQAGRLNEMEQEIETTKRMLTNERYERERMAQMLKQTTENNL